MRALNLDLGPLLQQAVGFDELVRAADTLRGQVEGYPPHNIEKLGDDRYQIAVAVAGFSADEIVVTAEGNSLTVVGSPVTEDKAVYLHKGIARRAFRRVFKLAEYIQVGEAKLVNGLLTIDLAREVPEAMKPRSIEIKTGA